MKVIYKDSIQTIEKDYPNKDIKTPVIGLDSDIKYYFIQVENIENPNSYRFNVIPKSDELTDELHPEFGHLKICKRGFELQEKPQNEIIERLNLELGAYLDSEYLPEIRIKHTFELTQPITDERKSYILSLNNWLNDCRKIRDKRESDYLNNNIFPEFNNYPTKP